MQNGNQESNINFSLIKKVCYFSFFSNNFNFEIKEDLEEFESFLKKLKSIKIVSVEMSPAFDEWLDIVSKSIYSDIERDWVVLRDFLGYKEKNLPLPSSSSLSSSEKTSCIII